MRKSLFWSKEGSESYKRKRSVKSCVWNSEYGIALLRNHYSFWDPGFTNLTCPRPLEAEFQPRDTLENSLRADTVKSPKKLPGSNRPYKVDLSDSYNS